MSDFEKLINASDLIEWIMETYPDWCVGDVRSIVDHVEQLPSAQPEIIRCKDCKYNYGLTHGGEFNPNDIVCAFFDTDGMQYCDYCSYAERVNNELV